VFGDLRPAHIVMQITRLINAEWLVEIEAGAIIT
jgi:hypothetical protein